MDLILRRDTFSKDGIFGQLRDLEGNLLVVTLEHAFPGGGSHPWTPKVAPRIYKCQRGLHQLFGMTHKFETFEITGVPPFNGKSVSGILFHTGNWNQDSSGCSILGMHTGIVSDRPAVIASHQAFNKFMTAQSGIDEFKVTIVDGT